MSPHPVGDGLVSHGQTDQTHHTPHQQNYEQVLRHKKKKDMRLANKNASYMQVATCTFNILMSTLLSMLMSYSTHSAQKEGCHILY